MRVIAGSARGRRLKAPRGWDVRPTADRVKEAVFDLIRGDWEERTVLDLFAGSGALGIEALSRGAGEAVFVEADRRCLSILWQNVEYCGFSDRTRVIRSDVLRFLGSRRSTWAFSIIFADPPYERGLACRCFSGVDSGGWLASQGRMIVEHSHREALPERGALLALFDKRRYGDTSISVYGLGEGTAGKGKGG
jgi:16S rRNA (guanine966-N2)-methyltransferase